MGSKPFSMNGIDWKKILIHAAVYGVAQAIIYGLMAISKLDLGAYTPFIGLVLGGIMDAVRKFLQDNSINP